MRSSLRSVLALVLVAVFALALAGCSETAEPTQEPEATPSDAQSAEQPPDTEPSVEPLPDEQLYADVLATGLAFSYDLTPADGEIEITENMDGYGAITWTDSEARTALVTRRYVDGEPEEWVYVDEGAPGSGVTELAPTGEQLQRYDALAQSILDATGASGTPTRAYAWTSESGMGTAAYATDGVTDDPNIHISFGKGELLQRVDMRVR